MTRGSRVPYPPQRAPLLHESVGQHAIVGLRVLRERCPPNEIRSMLKRLTTPRFTSRFTSCSLGKRRSRMMLSRLEIRLFPSDKHWSSMHEFRPSISQIYDDGADKFGCFRGTKAFMAEEGSITGVSPMPIRACHSAAQMISLDGLYFFHQRTRRTCKKHGRVPENGK